MGTRWSHLRPWVDGEYCHAASKHRSANESPLMSHSGCAAAINAVPAAAQAAVRWRQFRPRFPQMVPGSGFHDTSSSAVAKSTLTLNAATHARARAHTHKHARARTHSAQRGSSLSSRGYHKALLSTRHTYNVKHLPSLLHTLNCHTLQLRIEIPVPLCHRQCRRSVDAVTARANETQR